MNNKMLALGGFVLLTGGALYWYLSKTNGAKQCEEYKTKVDCLANNCYWYDGNCHNSSPTKCKNMIHDCDPRLEGYQECDEYYNLCRCENGRWVCIDDNSKICRQGITQAKCFINKENESECMLIEGGGGDECEFVPYTKSSVGCSCPTGKCAGDTAWCEPFEQLCIEKAYNLTVSADNPSNNKEYTYFLDKPYAATTLTGQLHYKWGSDIDRHHIEVWVGYPATGWECVHSDDPFVWSGSGSHTIQATFTTRGVTALAFEVSSGISNVTPDSFVGKLSY